MRINKTIPGMVVAVAMAFTISMTACSSQEEAQTESTPVQEQAEEQVEEAQEQTEEQVEETQEQAEISADMAKDIAFADAGVSESDVVDLSVELDYDDDTDTTHYEVSFEAGTTEYDYDIDPITGDILYAETDVVD